MSYIILLFGLLIVVFIVFVGYKIKNASYPGLDDIELNERIEKLEQKAKRHKRPISSERLAEIKKK